MTIYHTPTTNDVFVNLSKHSARAKRIMCRACPYKPEKEECEGGGPTTETNHLINANVKIYACEGIDWNFANTGTLVHSEHVNMSLLSNTALDTLAQTIPALKVHADQLLSDGYYQWIGAIYENGSPIYTTVLNQDVIGPEQEVCICFYLPEKTFTVYVDDVIHQGGPLPMHIVPSVVEIGMFELTSFPNMTFHSLAERALMMSVIGLSATILSVEMSGSDVTNLQVAPLVNLAGGTTFNITINVML